MTGFKRAIFLLGPPGSGKTTQARLLASYFSLNLIDGGAILREKFSDGRLEVGEKEALEAYEKGEMVDPSRMLEWLREEIAKNEDASGIVFSGSLRTVYEAERLILQLENKGFEVWIFHLDLTLGESIKRNTKRNRDATDAEEKIKDRWQEYEKEARPVVEKLKDKIIHINGERSVDEIHRDLRSHLGGDS